ncbi:MAG: membrane integrity-associated transporter subunit PqiC [Hyphomicrobiales bacterium]|nr:membrane integrity-associated transporter subunit PqiC [Hyphomicrobiales bacterium]
MGLARAGGPFRKRWRTRLVAALALPLSACASGPPLTVIDLTPAKPPAARPLRAQIRLAEPVATLDLDSERILVRDGQNLALLGGVRWPQQLSSLFRARLVEAFQNAGLARFLDGGGATAEYELDLDLRAFELDATTNEAHVEVAARIVSLRDGLVTAVEILSAREPAASSDPGAVVAALNQASSIMMTKIVAFVAKRL